MNTVPPIPFPSTEARVLLVDDDRELCQMLTEYLNAEHFEVNSVHDGGQALQELRGKAYEIVILDVMLPSVSGFDVLREIGSSNAPPVLMLTARGEDVDRIVGLELGADDYLAKPFNPRELVARVKAILRRSSGPRAAKDDAGPIHVGDVSIDQSRREVTVAGKPATLRAKEFDLLHTLAENRGRVLTREQLLNLVWGYDFLGQTRTIDVHVAHLRKILAGSRVSIETVTGIGYKLVGG